MNFDVGEMIKLIIKIKKYPTIIRNNGLYVSLYDDCVYIMKRSSSTKEIILRLFLK